MVFPTDRHRRAADRLTAKYGGGAVLTCIDDGGTDAWGNPTTTETTHNLRALDTGSKEAFGVTPGRDDGARIGVINVLDTGAVPKIGDKLEIGGETIALKEVEPIQPNPDQDALMYRYMGTLA
ncbi:MAG: hypothetical protein NXI12_02885 [Alphaproteobacteria bacterium]|nr:hypothetical protein [Alphaproteobacteria bacterium]